jgi:hypothetical protein
LWLALNEGSLDVGAVCSEVESVESHQRNAAIVHKSSGHHEQMKQLKRKIKD